MLLPQEGLSVSFDGREATLFGTVLFILADTLAAHQLGGIKVGIGFAIRICRECMATKDHTKQGMYILAVRDSIFK